MTEEDNLLDPRNLLTISRQMGKTDELNKVDALYGFGIYGKVLCSALSYLYNKPHISKELINRSRLDVFPEDIHLLIVTDKLDTARDLVKEIKNIRKKGVYIGKLISVYPLSKKVKRSLRIAGIKAISVK